MKNFLLCISAFLLTLTLCRAQDGCSKFYPLEEGTSFQYTNYDKKGKIAGTVDYTISKVLSEGSATNATYDMTLSDKKGKQIFESNYEISCENGMVSIDFESLFPSQMLQQFSEMEIDMDITGTDLKIPNDLSVGEDLEDANVSMALNMAGIKMTTTVDQMNRKVEKKENITVAAGTFDCYLITETNLTKTMGTTLETDTKMWLAEGVGLVQQESYKKNGNLITRMELTKLDK